MQDLNTLDEQIRIFENNVEWVRKDGDLLGCLNFRQMAEWLQDYKRMLEMQMEPCDDAISRQAVLDIVDSYSESRSNVEDVTQDMISDILALPPVTPKQTEITLESAIDYLHSIGWLQKHDKELTESAQKQRTGHWIIISPTDMYCSECNEIEHLDTSRKFCAYCGTKMSENPTGLESEEQA